MSDYYQDSVLTFLFNEAEPKKEQYLLLIKKAESPASLLGEAYRLLVNQGAITRIEDIPFDHKDRLWRESAIKKTRRDRINYCRAKYLLETI